MRRLGTAFGTALIIAWAIGACSSTDEAFTQGTATGSSNGGAGSGNGGAGATGTTNDLGW